MQVISIARLLYPKYCARQKKDLIPVLRKISYRKSQYNKVNDFVKRYGG